MTRRALLVAGAAGAAWPLRADDAQQVLDLFDEMASALSDHRPEEFMQAFDRKMPGYEMLQADVNGLLLQSDVVSSIEVLSDDGDSVARAVELDWILQIVDQSDSANATRRRERVRCRLLKVKKKWRITAFDPLAFFAPVA